MTGTSLLQTVTKFSVQTFCGNKKLSGRWGYGDLATQTLFIFQARNSFHSIDTTDMFNTDDKNHRSFPHADFSTMWHARNSHACTGDEPNACHNGCLDWYLCLFKKPGILDRWITMSNTFLGYRSGKWRGGVNQVCQEGVLAFPTPHPTLFGKKTSRKGLEISLHDVPGEKDFKTILRRHWDACVQWSVGPSQGFLTLD